MDETDIQIPKPDPAQGAFKGPISLPDQSALLEFMRKNIQSKAASGIASSVPGGSTHYAIAHGLGTVPKAVFVSGYAAGGALGFVIPYVNTTGSPPVADATSIYINISGAAACDVYWAATA